MSDEGLDDGVVSEELLTRHRKEKKELQAHIQHLKKHINKDKKKKKEAVDEIERLERDLRERHAEELAAAAFAPTPEVNRVSDGVNSVSLDADAAGEEQEEKDDCDVVVGQCQEREQQGRKMSKAEKRRQKKADANRERDARIRDAMANNKYSARSVEAEKLKLLLRERKLKMVEIQPDGNCMYAAIAHQLGGDTTVAWLRGQAGQYIRGNYDDFSPFITDPNTGELLTPDQFSDYCDRIESTPLWGGQPELRALSQVMKRRIDVLQAEGSPIVFGESSEDQKSILLAYYRHYYGLGEHYNSVTPLTTSPEEDSTEES